MGCLSNTVNTMADDVISNSIDMFILEYSSLGTGKVTL